MGDVQKAPIGRYVERRLASGMCSRILELRKAAWSVSVRIIFGSIVGTATIVPAY